VASVVAKLGIDLVDGTSGPANAAAEALERLRKKIDADSTALRGMNAAMKQLQGGSRVSVEAFRNLKEQIEAKKHSIAKAQAAYVSLGGVFGKVNKGVAQASDSWAGFGEAAQAAQGRSKLMGVIVSGLAKHANANAVATNKQAEAQRKQAREAEFSQASIGELLKTSKGLLGSMGGMPGRLSSVAEGLGAAGLAGAAIAAVAAIVLLSAAIIGGFVRGLVAMLSEAISATEAVAMLGVSLEAAAIAGKQLTVTGGALAQVVGDVASRVPLAGAKVNALAADLLKAGVEADQLGSALEAAAIGESVGVGAEALKSLKDAAKAGGDVEAVAGKIQKKYGALAAVQMRQLSVQFAKAKENASALFSGVNTTPLLDGARQVLQLFESTSSTGKALKEIIETLLNPIFGAAPDAGSALRSAFRAGVIAALKFGIVVMTIKQQLEDMLDVDLGGMSIDWAALGTAAMVVAGALALGAAVVGVFVGGILLMTAGVLAAIGVVVAFGAGLAWLVGMAAAKATEFVAAGANFALGLADGILGGMSSVINAAKTLASKAVDTVKSTLGIKSPSSVMFDQAGKPTAQGMAGGIEANAGLVENAADDLATGAIVAPKRGGGVGGGSVGAITVNVYGVEGADDPAFARKVADALNKALDGMAGEAA
jgi:hypothetical protein